MDYSLLTPEQQAALGYNRGKNTTVYENDQSIIDETTGEVLRHSHTSISKVSSEPDYIKVYYKVMLSFAGADGIPLDFILALSTYITWSNDGQDMYFQNSRMSREQIQETCNIKESMYKRYLKRCVDKGLLMPSTKYRGTYEVNPFFIARGKWDSIKVLQTTFDYVSGRWVRAMAEPASLTTLNPSRSVEPPKEEYHQMDVSEIPGVLPGEVSHE